MYIFYPSNEDALFCKYKPLKNEAQIRKNKIELFTNNIVELIEVGTISDFVSFWNGINENGKIVYNITDVYLIFHGKPYSVEIGENGEWLFSADNYSFELYGYDNSIQITELNDMKIENLHITSCNSGNIDFFYNDNVINIDSQYNIDDGGERFCDNIAYSFAKTMKNVKRVYGVDGYSGYNIFGDYSTEHANNDLEIELVTSVYNGDFYTWSYIANGTIRKSNGIICYERNGDEIKISPLKKQLMREGVDYVLENKIIRFTK